MAANERVCMGQVVESANPDESLEDVEAFRNLVTEAVVLCLAADAQLGEQLIRLLKMEQPCATAGAKHRPQPVSALRTCFRMLIYAHIEAHQTVELLHWVEGLELCIEQLGERLHAGQIRGLATPWLHS